MRVKILGRNWNFKFVPNLGTDEDGDMIRGLCDAPTTPGKTIWVRQGLSEEETLSTIIHEVSHGADWWKDEEFIDRFGDDLARILIRLGYRRER